jgi:hypothetical protein
MPLNTPTKATWRGSLSGSRAGRAGEPRPRSSGEAAAGYSGNLLEWRIDRENPVAAILRIWRLDATSAGGNEPQEELVLLKLRPEGSCRVVTIPARRPDANEVIRAMSLQVAAMPCLGDD